MDIFIFLKVMKVLSLSSFLFYSVISLFFFIWKDAWMNEQFLDIPEFV
jgi:hypothetical protein